MQFKDFVEHIAYGECFNLAIGMALREGDADEREAAKRQIKTHLRQGLMGLAEQFDIFVGNEAAVVPAEFQQIRIKDPLYLRPIEVTGDGEVLKPYGVQHTDNWDYKSVSHGLFTFNSRWANRPVQFLYKRSPEYEITDTTEFPTPFVDALSAYVAHRCHNTLGNHTPEMLSVFYARYRASIEALEDAGYGSIMDRPAKNVYERGFV